MILKRIAIFIELAFRRVSFITLFFDIIITHGAAGRFDESGINGNTLVDTQPFFIKLFETSLLI